MKKSTTVGAAQAVLILIARTAWAMYQSFLENFTSFNPKYTEQYGKDAASQVDKAAAFPSVEEINGVVTGYFNKVKASGLSATNLCQFLFKYIEDTFDPTDWAAAKREAGISFYAKATRGNWPSLSKLLEAATAFMVTYAGTLTQPGKGMPAEFPVTFATAKAKYDTDLQNFSTARQDAKLQTAARVATYKAIHATLLAMLKDAQRIFRFDEANKKAFTFAAIKRTIAPEASGVHISINESITALPVTTAHIVFQPGNVQSDANKKGIATSRLKAGTYSATITIPGHETILLTPVKVEAGTMHRLRLIAQKEAAIAA